MGMILFIILFGNNYCYYKDTSVMSQLKCWQDLHLLLWDFGLACQHWLVHYLAPIPQVDDWDCTPSVPFNYNLSVSGLIQGLWCSGIREEDIMEVNTCIQTYVDCPKHWPSIWVHGIGFFWFLLWWAFGHSGMPWPYPWAFRVDYSWSATHIMKKGIGFLWLYISFCI